MDRKSFLWMRPLIIQPDSTIHGGRLDKLITFSSINNDNRDPITRMHDPFIPSPVPLSARHFYISRIIPCFIHRVIRYALYNVPLIDPFFPPNFFPFFTTFIFGMNSLFFFYFISSYLSLSLVSFLSSRSIVTNERFFFPTLRTKLVVKNGGSRLHRVNEFKLRNERIIRKDPGWKTRVRRQLNDGVIEAR